MTPRRDFNHMRFADYATLKCLFLGVNIFARSRRNEYLIGYCNDGSVSVAFMSSAEETKKRHPAAALKVVIVWRSSGTLNGGKKNGFDWRSVMLAPFRCVDSFIANTP